MNKLDVLVALLIGVCLIRAGVVAEIQDRAEDACLIIGMRYSDNIPSMLEGIEGCKTKYIKSDIGLFWGSSWTFGEAYPELNKNSFAKPL